MTDDEQNVPKLKRQPGKYDVVAPDWGHWGICPGEPIRFRDKANRKRVMGKGDPGEIAKGTHFNPFDPSED